MRLIFLKLFASGTLLLGLLGPQVASGEQVRSVPTNNPSQTLEVVSSTSGNYNQILVTQGSLASDCGPVNSFLDRMDLLIWQVCGSIVVSEQAEQPQLAVVSSPTYIPTVSVAKTDLNWLATGSIKQSHSASDVSLIPTGSFTGWAVRTKNQNIFAVKTFTTSSYIEDSQNSFTTVSMRC